MVFQFLCQCRQHTFPCFCTGAPLWGKTHLFGVLVGNRVGWSVGTVDGFPVGLLDGLLEGDPVGSADDTPVGSLDG